MNCSYCEARTHENVMLRICESCIHAQGFKKVAPIGWIRSLTAKLPRNASQREKNIYRSACALLAALELPEDVEKKCPECEPCVKENAQ